MTRCGSGCISPTCCAEATMRRRIVDVPSTEHLEGSALKLPRVFSNQRRQGTAQREMGRLTAVPSSPTPQFARRAGWPPLSYGGGKSGLPEAMVPGNARAGQPDGKRHREQTAPILIGVRVKRWGKSPPGGWQQRPHGKPHREQCRIGGSRRVSAGSLQPRSPGWQHEAGGNIGPRGMVIHPRGNPRGTESGLQALRAFFWAFRAKNPASRVDSPARDGRRKLS